jgi:hypothetical protein
MLVRPLLPNDPSTLQAARGSRIGCNVIGCRQGLRLHHRAWL